MLLRACGLPQGPHASKLETPHSSQVSPARTAKGGPLVLIKGRQMLPSSSPPCHMHLFLGIPGTKALWVQNLGPRDTAC